MSHELRNPLNSISAQNDNKKYLYKKLMEIIMTIINTDSKEIH